MPIYEYQCTACDHRLETIQKMSDAPLSECPECGKPDLKRLISASGFQLKGSGWYATDFKGDKKVAKETKETKEEKAAVPACGTGACPACTE